MPRRERTTMMEEGEDDEDKNKGIMGTKDRNGRTCMDRGDDGLGMEGSDTGWMMESDDEDADGAGDPGDASGPRMP